MRADLGPTASYNHGVEIINGLNNVSKNLNAGIEVRLFKSKDKKYDISLSNRYSYNSNATQQYNKIIKYSTNELGVDGTVYYKKVWAVKSDFNFYARQRTPQFPDNLSNQLWNARAQRTFKSNEFTVFFMIRDILNQNTGIQRNFYSNTLSEVRNERLKRYWMMGFTWDFKNKSATTAPTK